nr:hypothetical protein [Sulfitobacter faviae]
MRTQTAVLVRVKFSDGSEGIGEGTTIGGLSYGAESPRVSNLRSIPISLHSCWGVRLTM